MKLNMFKVTKAGMLNLFMTCIYSGNQEYTSSQKVYIYKAMCTNWHPVFINAYIIKCMYSKQNQYLQN